MKGLHLCMFYHVYNNSIKALRSTDQRSICKYKPEGKALVSASVTNLRVRLLDILTSRHETQPLMNSRMIIQRQSSKRMLSDPRLKVEIHSSHSGRKNTHSIRLLQLTLEYIIASVYLSSVPFQGVVILLRMIVPKASGYKQRAKHKTK